MQQNIQPISSEDAYIAGLLFDITDTSKNNPISRVRISSNLLNNARDEMLKKIDYSEKINNKTLITYALLNLLNPHIKDKLRYQLQEHDKNPALSKLLSVQNDPRQTESHLNNQILHEILDELRKQTLMHYAEITGISWNVKNDMAMNIGRQGIAQNGDDVYAKLRLDDFKQVIDGVLRAGVNEYDRQRHLNTIK